MDFLKKIKIDYSFSPTDKFLNTTIDRFIFILSHLGGSHSWGSLLKPFLSQCLDSGVVRSVDGVEVLVGLVVVDLGLPVTKPVEVNASVGKNSNS